MIYGWSLFEGIWEMSVEIADRWFEIRKVDADITHLWEPYVDPVLRCNIWHVRGRDRDMLVDTGMGVASLYDATRHLIDKPVDAVATHCHSDHIGSHYEFENRVVHAKEAEIMAAPNPCTLDAKHWQVEMEGTGYDIGSRMLTKHPCSSYCEADFEIRAAAPTRIVEEGDVIDLGNRQFEIMHLPGHSPGSMGLWEERTGTLFSGDAIYDGPLLDKFDDCDIELYIETMRRLRDLPVTVVHGGHDPSFDRERLIELCDAYLHSKGV